MRFLAVKTPALVVVAGLTACGAAVPQPPPPPPSKGQITFSFGAEETVFSYATDSCEALDGPDTPAHAVRFADCTLMLADKKGVPR